MKKWLLQFVQLAKQALVRHPVELLLVAICGAIPIFAPEPKAMMERYADFLLWAPMAFMLVNLTHGNKYYRLSIFIPIAFGVLATLVDLNDFTQSARFGILNLAVLVIFLCSIYIARRLGVIMHSDAAGHPLPRPTIERSDSDDTISFDRDELAKALENTDDSHKE